MVDIRGHRRLAGHPYKSPSRTSAAQGPQTAFWEITPARGTFPRSASAYSFGGGEGIPMVRGLSQRPESRRRRVDRAAVSGASDCRDARALCGWRSHASPMRAMRCGRWRCASTARTSSDHEGRRGSLRGESGAAFAPESPEEGEDAGRVFLRVRAGG